MLKLSLRFALLLLLVTGLVSCGSGGGGGGGGTGGNSGSSLQYTGSTYPAALTDINSVEVSKETYMGGGTGTAIGGRSLNSTTGSNKVRRPNTFVLASVLESAITKADLTSSTDLSKTALNGNLIPDATCAGGSGTGSLSLDYNDTTGSFTGTFTFNSFCSEGVNLTGTVATSGLINPFTLDIIDFTMFFDSLAAVAADYSDTASGTITYAISGSSETVTLDLLLRDDATSKVYKMENFHVGLLTVSNYVDMTIQSGRFFHPDHGYVDVTTVTPLRYYNDEEWPSGGVLIFTGLSGARVRLTVYLSESYSVETDSDGNGSYEYDSGMQSWQDTGTSDGDTTSQLLPIIRASVASDGNIGNNHSFRSSMSGDGRYVAFDSSSSNLVANDTNNAHDVFVHDRQTETTTRISIASDGTQGNNNSSSPSISADGRYVTFVSYSTNLVANDTNGEGDIFVHDRQTGNITKVNITSDGTQGNNHSSAPSISADGRYVAFQSDASNLVANDTNYASDVFVHDRQTATTTIVSVASNGTQGNSYNEFPSISEDGRHVAFTSYSNNLVTNDNNVRRDVFVHDRQTGETTMVSVASDGTHGNTFSKDPSISADGRYVAFWSWSNTLVDNDTNDVYDIFVRDRQTETTTRVSVASGGTQASANGRKPSISPDGRYVAFSSSSPDLVTNDTNNVEDIFIHDRQTGTTTRVSHDSNGAQGELTSYYPSISADGQYVAFTSVASILVTGDTNDRADIYVAPHE